MPGGTPYLRKRAWSDYSSRAVEFITSGRISSKATVQCGQSPSYYQSLVLKIFQFSPAWSFILKYANGEQLIARRVDAIHGTVLANETLEAPANTQMQRTTTNSLTATQSLQQLNKKGNKLVQEQGLRVLSLLIVVTRGMLLTSKRQNKMLVDCGLTG